jgi:hypothetical protein
MVLLAAPEIKAQIGEIFAKLAPMRQPRLRLIEALV